MRGAAVVALVALASSASVAQQPAPRVYVRTAGPGRPAEIVRETLARPHHLVVAPGAAARRRSTPSDTARPSIDFRRDTTLSTPLLVVGGDVTVASTVRGDVVVVAGDLFLHPGAMIDGRAVAIGGGVYNSTLASVRGGRLDFRDITFDVAETADGLALDYRDLERKPVPLVQLPLVYGLRIPTYDRVNGATIPWGPLFNLDTARIQIEPIIAYRSHLGDIDPWVEGRAEIGRRTNLTLAGGRGTFTNDAWIRGDLLNSVGSAFNGRDTRNYYRAWRAEAVARRAWVFRTVELEPFVGALTEDTWATGPDLLTTKRPWSLFGRGDREEGMLRPNPKVRRGHITSGTAGARVEYQEEDVTGSASVQVEVPVQALDDSRFVQTTVQVNVEFPTFGSHSFAFESHAVMTSGDRAPMQRFAYLGGSGTLPTLDLLSMGGDQLFFAEGRYAVPIERFKLPFVGPPTVMLRYMAGSAGSGKLPDLVQNLGVRVSLAIVRADFVYDPVARTTDLGLGFSLSR